MRGPQRSSLVVGKAELIDAARMDVSPASSAGAASMKVGKEELMGMLAAVELFLDGSDEEDYRWPDDAELIVAGEGIEDVRASVDDGDQRFFPGGVPRVRMEIIGGSSADAYDAPLRDGEAQCLDGRLRRRHVRRPHDPAARRGQQVARRLREVLTGI